MRLRNGAPNAGAETRLARRCRTLHPGGQPAWGLPVAVALHVRRSPFSRLPWPDGWLASRRRASVRLGDPSRPPPSASGAGRGLDRQSASVARRKPPTWDNDYVSSTSTRWCAANRLPFQRPASVSTTWRWSGGTGAGGNRKGGSTGYPVCGERTGGAPSRGSRRLAWSSRHSLDASRGGSRVAAPDPTQGWDGARPGL